MSNHHQQLADQVVSVFRGHLDTAEQERIGEARFLQLHQLICEALSAERQTITDRMQELLQELRKEVEKPDLEL